MSRKSKITSLQHQLIRFIISTCLQLWTLLFHLNVQNVDFLSSQINICLALSSWRWTPSHPVDAVLLTYCMDRWKILTDSWIHSWQQIGWRGDSSASWWIIHHKFCLLPTDSARRCSFGACRGGWRYLIRSKHLNDLPQAGWGLQHKDASADRVDQGNWRLSVTERRVWRYGPLRCHRYRWRKASTMPHHSDRPTVL